MATSTAFHCTNKNTGIRIPEYNLLDLASYSMCATLMSAQWGYYAQKFTFYAMLECLKLCPIMLFLRPYYAHTAS